MAHVAGPWAYDESSNHVVSTTEVEDWSIGLDDEPPRPKQVLCTFGAMGGDDNRSDLALLVASPELLDMVRRLSQASDMDALRAMRAEADELAARATDYDLVRRHEVTA
jgi:hypothetical protein